MSSSDNKSGFPGRERQEMERDWKLRQENVLPVETAQNEGRFYGRALKGSRPLTGVQRTGILLIGLQAVSQILSSAPARPSSCLDTCHFFGSRAWASILLGGTEASSKHGGSPIDVEKSEAT